MALVPSPAFSDEPFAEALTRAEAEQRWLVVEVADAANPESWAAAYTTWRDGDLLSWVEKYAIAIRSTRPTPA